MADSCFCALSVVLTVLLLLLGLLPSATVRAEMPAMVTVAPDDSPTATNDEGTTTRTTTTTTSALSFLKDCRSAGFDPMQLACTTCAILPEKHRGKCEECCQSYRTLEKRSKRYEMAYLLNTGYPESVREFVQEDMDGILEQKGRTRLHVQDFAMDRVNTQMGMMGLFQQQEPSAIFWFDKRINVDAELQEIVQSADEITVLSGRGLGRDDMRDMLLTLLPDKK